MIPDERLNGGEQGLQPHPSDQSPDRQHHEAIRRQAEPKAGLPAARSRSETVEVDAARYDPHTFGVDAVLFAQQLLECPAQGDQHAGPAVDDPF